MLIICSAAYLKICECGLHGHIMTAKDVRGPDFASKQMGLVAMRLGLTYGFITDDEMLELERQIVESSLPKTDEEASLFAITCALVLSLNSWEESMRAAQKGEATTH
jgi:hypothetical protein